jgi:ketol-acid reductoisomerase
LHDAHWQPPHDRPLEDADVSLAPLAGRQVAVIGYGTMGRAHALNLRDSGVAVVVGARDGSARAELARAEGFTVQATPRVVAGADVVMLLLPDEAMATVYAAEVAPQLRPQAALGFAHGFAIAFGQILPEPGRACFLAAPKSQGDLLRESFVRGAGVPGLLAVSEDSPAGTWALAAAYARAVGCLRGGGWRTTFRRECVSDQFGEQVVLCGGVIELLQAAFDTLVGRGYDAHDAYFECVHELDLITRLVRSYGVDGMRRRISRTAAYGGLTRGPRVIDPGVRARMAAILDDIESGSFAREFLAHHDDPAAGVAALAAREAQSSLAQAGHRLQARLAAMDQRKGDPA